MGAGWFIGDGGQIEVLSNGGGERGGMRWLRGGRGIRANLASLGSG